MVDDLIVGNAVQEVSKACTDGRIIALMAPGIDTNAEWVINRYRGSGLRSDPHRVWQKVQAGMADCIIAGGTESMSLVPVMGWKTALNYTIAKDNPTYRPQHGPDRGAGSSTI